jgi:outer membrane protein TolC
MGCSQLGDPARKGQTSCHSGVMWTFCSPHIPPYNVPCVTVPPEGVELSGGELINIALGNNPQTKQTWAMAKAAAYNWRATQSAYYPEIEFIETVAFNEVAFPDISTVNSPNETGITFGGFTAVAIHQFTLNFLLFDFGGRDATVEAARQGLLAANWTNNREIQTVVLQVLENYYNHLAALGDQDAKIKNLEDARANLAAAEKKFDVGLAQIVEVLQAKSEFVDAERALQVADGQVINTMGQLATSLGFAADAKLNLKRLPEDLKVESIQDDVEKLMCEARELRPDLAASYAVLLQKKAEVREAISAGLPTVNALGNTEIYNFMSSNGTNGAIYTGAIEVSVPIFNGWYHYNTIWQTREEASAADASLREKELDVYLQVWTSYTNVNTAKETVAFTNELLAYTEKAYQAALESYKQGTGSFLDVLNTQDSLAAARAKWIQSRTDWLNSLAQLAYATGRI